MTVHGFFLQQTNEAKDYALTVQDTTTIKGSERLLILINQYRQQQLFLKLVWGQLLGY